MSETSTPINDLPQVSIKQQPVQQQYMQQQPIQQQTIQQQPIQQQPIQQQPISVQPMVNNNSLNHTDFQNIVNAIEKNMDQKGYTSSLPSRDIPLGTQHLAADSQSKPNYVPPPPSKSVNFVDNQHSDYHVKDHNINKFHQKIYFLERAMENSYQTIVNILLYFIYQQPFMNDILRKVNSRLFNETGTLKTSGLFLKSLLFGISAYVCQYSLDVLSQS